MSYWKSMELNSYLARNCTMLPKHFFQLPIMQHYNRIWLTSTQIKLSSNSISAQSFRRNNKNMMSLCTIIAWKGLALLLGTSDIFDYVIILSSVLFSKSQPFQFQNSSLPTAILVVKYQSQMGECTVFDGSDGLFRARGSCPRNCCDTWYSICCVTWHVNHYEWYSIESQLLTDIKIQWKFKI